MVDKIARNSLTDSLLKFASRQLTNSEFENSIPDSKDPIIGAIYSSVWCLFDDFKEEPLDKEVADNKEFKDKIDRWILFLRTDLEYKWPEFRYPGVRPVQHSWLGKLAGTPKKEAKFMAFGDYEVWPFYSKSEYQK